jgi:hypothetical protein
LSPGEKQRNSQMFALMARGGEPFRADRNPGWPLSYVFLRPLGHESMERGHEGQQQNQTPDQNKPGQGGQKDQDWKQQQQEEERRKQQQGGDKPGQQGGNKDQQGGQR